MMAMKLHSCRHFRVDKMISVLISDNDFDVATEYETVCRDSPGAGAVVFFVGLVRDLYAQDSSDHIDYIELSHYHAMTERLCEKVCQKANVRFPYQAARVVHRVGKLGCGEQIVFVAVASRHRKNAFCAAEYIMDHLKTEATLWKKEVGRRGERWIGMKQQDQKAALRWQQT